MLDSLDDLADSMNTALARLGLPPHPTDAYRYFVGDGARNLVERALPPNSITNEILDKCLALMLAEYRRRWSNNTKPYPGIPEMLSALEKIGLPKTILSNKADDFTQIIVNSFLSDFSFQIVRGLLPSARRKPDPTSALQIADELKILPSRFLYLGDTKTDMQTAIAAGMYPVGALWGFRQADELLANGAKTLVKTPDDFLKLL